VCGALRCCLCDPSFEDYIGSLPVTGDNVIDVERPD
jgi:hypothetical protein